MAGGALAGKLPFSRKAPTIQAALLEDITEAMGSNFNSSRFIPYVMMHEFEGLLFSCSCAVWRTAHSAR